MQYPCLCSFQTYHRITTTVLRAVYSTADCMSLQLGTVTTVTTDFVGKSHGLLMHILCGSYIQIQLIHLVIVQAFEIYLHVYSSV